jgi:hypothetical protein
MIVTFETNCVIDDIIDDQVRHHVLDKIDIHMGKTEPESVERLVYD